MLIWGQKWSFWVLEVKKDSTFLMNHCSWAQWYNTCFWWVLVGWSSGCVSRLCQESILSPKFCEITGRQIWLLVLLIPEMSLAPRQSCNFIYGMKEVEWAAENYMAFITLILSPLFTYCCCAEAAFAMPLRCSLQRDFGIKSSSCESICPTKGMGRGPVVVGRGIILPNNFIWII